MTITHSVILIHGHDIGRWISPYGHPTVTTPNLEAFSRNSVVFDRAFSTAPLCSPARGSMFTGLMPHEHGLMGLVHHAWRYREGVTTLPEYVRAAGYETVLVGLQHENVDPSVLGFDHVLSDGFLPRALPVADLAADWLRARDEAGVENPFLLTVGFWEAHRPWPEEDYTPAALQSVEVPAYLPDTEGTRRDLAAFYGALAQMDEAFGHLMAAIDATEAGREAIVIFTTDHGAAFPRAKSTLYDAGVGVSLVVRPPASWSATGTRHSGQVSHLDLVPTVLEAAGLDVPDSLSGVSLLPIIRGAGDPPAERTLYFEKSYHDGYDPLRAVRTEQFKYIKSLQPSDVPVVPADIRESETYRSADDWSILVQDAEELYDLSVDPDELINIAHETSQESTRAQLAEHLEDWMRRTGDPALNGPIPTPPRRSRAVDALPPLQLLTEGTSSD